MKVSRCIAQELLKFLNKYVEACGRFVLLFSSVLWGHVKATMRTIVPVVLLCCFIIKGKNKHFWFLNWTTNVTNVLFSYNFY